MEDINKDLVPFTMEQEAHFTAQVPMLFTPEFMKNVTEHGTMSRHSGGCERNLHLEVFKKLNSAPAERR